MLHILTIHFKDKWVDIQKNQLKKHISEEYKVYTRLGENYDTHKHKFDGAIEGKGHWTESMKLLLKFIEKNANSDDKVLLLDSDAFPISSNISNFMDLALQKAPFVSCEEPEHEKDNTREIPHPMFMLFKAKHILDGDISKYLSKIMDIDSSGTWWAGLLKWLSKNDYSYYPIKRSNKINLHPLYFGIYDNLIYHHWAGSRKMITRPDRRRAKKSGESLDSIAEENHKMSAKVFKKIENELDTFIEYLSGDCDNELRLNNKLKFVKKTNLIPKIQLFEIENVLKHFKVVRNKYNRIDNNGINQGRIIYNDAVAGDFKTDIDGIKYKPGELYYKLFNKNYIRKDNFKTAIEKNFFEGLAPALVGLIIDGDDIIGYISKAGQVLSNNEFDEHLIPDDFKDKIIQRVKDTGLFFYDLVPSNIIRLDDGQLSLIDLESVYKISELFNIKKHNAKIKPNSLYDVVYNEWRKQMKPISFIQPSRNNLKYLKWSYNSIRKNLGYIHEICMADDFSNDGTWEWMQEIVKQDPNVKIYRNEGPKRLGHTILYDTLINDYATNDIVMIYHADMYALPGLDEEVNKYVGDGKVVSLTRIEPPLHPPGPEKILEDYGRFNNRGYICAVGYNEKGFSINWWT